LNQLKRFSFVSIGYGISSLLAYVFYFLFAKILSIELFGELIYLFSIATVTVIVSRFGLGLTNTIQLARGNEEFTSQANVLHLILVVSFSIVLFFINPFLSILTIGVAFFMMDLNLLQGRRDYKKYLVISISCRIFQIIISLLLYYTIGFFGILLAAAIVTFFHSPHYLRSLFKWNFKFDQIKKYFTSNLHNFGVESSQILPNWTDKLLIVPLLGFSVAGIYQFGYQALLGLGILPMILYTYLLPEESSGGSTRRIIIGCLTLSIILTILTFFIAPLGVNSFFPEFEQSIVIIQILSVGLIPLTVITILNAKLQSKESRLVGIGAVLRIFSHLIMIPLLWKFLEYEGLAFAVIISLLIHMVYLIYAYFAPRFKEKITPS